MEWICHAYTLKNHTPQEDIQWICLGRYCSINLYATLWNQAALNCFITWPSWLLYNAGQVHALTACFKQQVPVLLPWNNPISNMCLAPALPCIPPSHLIYPITMRVVGAPQMISQPVFSIFPCSPLPSGTWWTPSLSIPWCCLPTSSFVRLVFFPFTLCLARWFWADLMNGRHVHTTAVCVTLRNSTITKL